jgi:WD domain, G-beta repeat
MANPLPAEFVRRPAEFDALMRLLLAQNRESPVAITAALSGAGGYGKTLMATAICHDRRIRSAFKDGIRAFLRNERKADLPTLNNQLLDAHRPDAGWAEAPNDDRYFWDHLADHLIEAGRGAELVATVKDWRYLAKKTLLRKSLSVENDLIQAMKYAPDDDPLRALRRTFANTGHIFNHCETSDDLHSTIFSRLQHLDELQAIVRELARHLASPRIVPKFDLPDLPHPALIRTLEGHSDYVKGCAFSLDGKLVVSTSADRTLKVWGARTGQTLATLFADGPMLCCVIHGEMIVAGGARGVYFLRLVR